MVTHEVDVGFESQLDSGAGRFYSGSFIMDDREHTAPNSTESCHDGSERFSYREPAALRSLRLFWEHRRLILGGSLLPALLVATTLYLWPCKYAATFVYERPLAESEYNVFLRRFHSLENLDKIIGRLQEQGLTNYVERLQRAKMLQSIERLIRFEASPMYPKRLLTTDPCTSEKISAFRAKLLSIEVFGNSAEEVTGVLAVVTGNIEGVLPVYDIRNQLKESIQKLRSDVAKIEDDRFKLSMDLQKEKAKLEKLQTLGGSGAEAAQDSVVLQFNNLDKGRDYLPWFYPGRTGASKTIDLQEILKSQAEKYNFYDFLPMSYQIRAAQSKIVDLQETLNNNTEKRNFYVQVLDLDNQLLAKIEESLLTDYTAQQYLGFLGERLRACQDQALCDHLRSYIRKTENLILVSTRAGEKPVVYPVSKGTVGGTALAFLLSLMVTTFAAVLLEHRRERLRQPSADRGLEMAD